MRADARPEDIPMVMCALAGASNHPMSNPDRYISLIIDGMRAPGTASWQTARVASQAPVLYHLAISHYSEKARWAFSYKGVCTHPSGHHRRDARGKDWPLADPRGRATRCR